MPKGCLSPVVVVHAQVGYDLVVRGLDDVFSVATDDSCHPHHKSREAWKNKGDTWSRPERQAAGEVVGLGSLHVPGCADLREAGA